METKVLRVLLIEEEEGWSAQALEVDIACQAKTLEGVVLELRRVFKGQIGLSEELGLSPFSNVGPAPQEFFESWKKSATEVNILDLERDKPTIEPVDEPTFSAQPSLRVGTGALQPV